MRVEEESKTYFIGTAGGSPPSLSFSDPKEASFEQFNPFEFNLFEIPI